MYQFFITPDQVRQDGILVSAPEDMNHIRNVLRMKPGEEISLCCPETEKEYICRIREFSEEGILAEITDILGVSRELPVKVTLFQGLAKGDKMETIIQKAVELGVHEVVPVAMNRCVVKLDAAKAKKKVQRYNTIAESAAKQSGRGYVPKVHPVMSFREAVEYAKQLSMILVPYEEAGGMAHTRTVLETVRNHDSVGVFIGPEGGFEKSEIETAQEADAHVITLGRRILRTETAGMTVLSILMYLLEEDDGE